MGEFDHTKSIGRVSFGLGHLEVSFGGGVQNERFLFWIFLKEIFLGKGWDFGIGFGWVGVRDSQRFGSIGIGLGQKKLLRYVF